MNARSWDIVGDILTRAIELPEEARAAFISQASEGDPTLQAEVASLLEAHQRAGRFLEIPAVELVTPPDSAETGADPRIGEQIGPYRIVARIGAGGMGEVYRAVRADGQYDRAVAIKLVRFGWKSAEMVERFRRERQILAALESPNIARLYDGGTTADGVPYVVMELVEGIRIDLYCREHGLSIPARLELYGHVCEAVQYAHQRLVVHRDIKPANILVTENGVPKLLDFGIARALEETGAREATKAVMMTPHYASPEQIRGGPITTASDIWSLGVVLYQLLTDQLPFAAERSHEVSDQIFNSTPPLPSAALRSAGQRPYGRAWRDLDNIVLKALRKEPGRRYATVQQLADDIARYQAGSTVSATPDSISYRLRTFARRHRVGVLMSIGALVLVSTGIALDVHEATLAAANGRRAERRFEDVHRLATSLVFELHDAIHDLPGSINARRLLTDRATRYLDDLAAEANGDPALQRDLAAALVRLGDVQGDPFGASLGDSAAAERSYGKAVALSEAVLAHTPGSTPDVLALAHALIFHASMLSMRGRILDARSEAERAARLVDNAAAARVGDPTILLAQYETYRDLGGILGGNFQSGNLGLQDDALRARQRALAAAQHLSALDPHQPEWRRKSLVAQTQLGDQMLLSGQTLAALEQYRATLIGFQQQLAMSGETAATLENIRDIYERLVSVAIRTNRSQEALDYASGGLDAAKKAASSDAADVHGREGVGIAQANLADTLILNGRFEEARNNAAEGVRILTTYAASDPSSNEPQATLALTIYIAGQVEYRAGKYQSALDRFRQAETIFRRTRDADRDNTDARLSLAEIEVRIGNALLRTSRISEAQVVFRQALADLEAGRLAEHSEEARYAAAGANAGLGAAEAMLAGEPRLSPDSVREHWAAACSWHRQGQVIWSQIREPGPESPNGFHTEVPAQWARDGAHCVARSQ